MAPTQQEELRCLNCGRTEQTIPLIPLRFLGGSMCVCPSCLPILIHSPQKLAGKLPGAESMDGAQHH